MKSPRPSKTVRSMIVLTLLAAGVFLVQTVGDRAYAQPQAADLVKADTGKVLIDPRIPSSSCSTIKAACSRPSRTSAWRNYEPIP